MPLRRNVALWVQALLVFAVVVTMVLVSVTTVLLLDQSRHAAQQRAEQTKLARLLVECTTAPQLREPPEQDVPPTDCYRRQLAAQARIVGEPRGPINTVIVAAAACGAAHPGDVPGTRRCVDAALAKG